MEKNTSLMLTRDGIGSELSRECLALGQSEAHACYRTVRTCMYPTIRSQAGLYSWWANLSIDDD
jgi:hypothetical protein